MQPPYVLLERALPGNRHRQKESVEPSVIKSFADVTTGRYNHPALGFRHSRERLRRRSTLFLAHSAFEYEDVFGECSDFSREILEVLLAPREQERRTSRRQGPSEIRSDHRVAFRIFDQGRVDILNRRIRQLRWHPEIRMTRDDPMFERRRFCHRPCAHVEPDRAALHVDDWMVAVLSYRGSREADYVSCLHLLHHLLEGEG